MSDVIVVPGDDDDQSPAVEAVVAMAAGQASAVAERAEETAEQAAQTAAGASETADAALDTAWDAQSAVAALHERLAAVEATALTAAVIATETADELAAEQSTMSPEPIDTEPSKPPADSRESDSPPRKRSIGDHWFGNR